MLRALLQPGMQSDGAISIMEVSKMVIKWKTREGVLWKLFVSTLYLSAFTFGGGYVIVSLLKKKFVDEYHWIENEEMLDLVAIAQSSPGAIAVNGAIVVGYKLARNGRNGDCNSRNHYSAVSDHFCNLGLLQSGKG